MVGAAGLVVQPIAPDHAAAIATWRYPVPYHFYDSAPGVEPYLLDPLRHYYAVLDVAGDLQGFFCYGREGQVRGGTALGLYADAAALDIGLGMRPDLIGQGRGRAFLAAGLAFGRAAFAPARFRLSVALFNQRAIRLYTQAGFQPGPVFPSLTHLGELEFLLMVREESS
jgi:GNAT superfamily N-acetyltransferase